MAKSNFKICLEKTLTRAFSCKDRTARLALLELADFYELQAIEQAMRENRGPLQIFR